MPTTLLVKAPSREAILFDGHRAHDLSAGSDRPFPDHEELGLGVAVDVGDEDLLGVGVARRVDDRLLPLAGAVPVHVDLTRLLLVELVRLARGREELGHAVAVDVADLDLVDEGVGLTVHLLDAPVLLGVDHRDDALIVGGDHQVVLAVAVDVAALDVAQAVELAAELRVPVRRLAPGAGGEAPGLEQGLIAADGEETVVPGQRLVEGVALRVLERDDLPAGRVPHDQELRGARDRLGLAVGAGRR